MGLVAGIGAGITAVAADVGIGASAAALIGSVGSGLLTGAAIGAGTSALTGGNVGMGALFGAVSGGTMAGFGGTLAGALGTSLSTSDALIGGGLGAVESAATGSNPLTGAIAGGIGGYGAGLMGVGGGSDTGGAPAMGSGTAAGTADAGGGWGAGAAATQAAPLAGAAGAAASGGTGAAGSAGSGGGLGSLLGGKTFGINNSSLALGALSALTSAYGKPQPSSQPTPSPSSVAANLGPNFNAPLQMGAPGRTPVSPFAGQGASPYYTYGAGPEQNFFTGNRLGSFGYSEGGSTDGHPSQHTGHVQTFEGPGPVAGPGDGQSDDVNARLADGEFVWDATTVSRLGNGSNRRGAEVLESARRAIANDAGSKRVVQKRIRKGALSYVEDARHRMAGAPR